MTHFKDVPVGEWFSLKGLSFRKTSAFGYFVDPVMGELQVQSDLEVDYPIAAKQKQIVPKAEKPKAKKAK